MRYSFIQELTKIASKNKNVIVLTADLGFTVFEEFAKKYPQQFFNVGVAESNMIGIAAGLALSGKTVFVYSISNFVTLRPFEQIRNDVCQHNASVVIVGTGAGLSYADAGPSHYGIQDIALMRCLPNMTVLCPSDPVGTKWAVREAVNLKSPVYLRLGKRGEPNIYNSVSNFKLGKGNWLKKGQDFALIATGNMVYSAIETCRLLENSGIRGSVIDMHTIKPIDQKLIKRLLKKNSYLITLEEHTVIGGLGSAVAEVISQTPNQKAQLLILGLPDIFPKKMGNQAWLRETYGLSPKKISLRIKKFIKASAKLSVILPVHNEESIIETVFKDIFRSVKEISSFSEFILVENGSKDKSLSIIKKISKNYPNTKWAIAPKGYGSAVIKGLSLAQGEYVCYMPSDGQIDLSVFKKLWKEIGLGKLDLVKAKRINRETTGRIIVSKTFSLVLFLLFRTPLIDINGSPRIFKKALLPSINLQSTDSFIDAEFLIKIKKLGLSIKEIPMKNLDRAGGASTRSIKTFLEFFSNILRFRLKTLSQKQ